MAKTIDIPIQEYYNKVKDWTTNFFQTIDKYETIAVSSIAVGIILLIVGLVIL